MRKTKDLIIVLVIYILAFVLGYLSCMAIEGLMLKLFIFDIVATVVTFIFSAILKNSSVYDPYWSFTPMLMSIWLFCVEGAFSIWQILFLIVFNIWGLRLTLNWCIVFTDFSYEDWRYRKFRDENPKVLWWIINFCGIHMVPTLCVFAGMLPLFEMAKNPLGPLSIIGMAIVLFGVAMEFFADRQMHAFLASKPGKVSCRNGLWKYSRHPNYLGEISVWLGTFVAMIVYVPARWYYGIGVVAMIVLFNVVSIPMMEKRQAARREDYADYKACTSRLIIRPRKKI